MRKTLATDKLDTHAMTAITGFHSEVVNEVEKAVASHEWVIVGMAQNVFVKKARKMLEKKGVKFHYLEYGSYFGQWKKRLAVKLWSGWATFPQVFHKGVLIGGAKELAKYLNA
jgi:monothiol glutaredoxin